MMKCWTGEGQFYDKVAPIVMEGIYSLPRKSHLIPIRLAYEKRHGVQYTVVASVSSVRILDEKLQAISEWGKFVLQHDS